MRQLFLSRLKNYIIHFSLGGTGLSVQRTELKWMGSSHYASQYRARWYLAYEVSPARYNPILSLGTVPVDFGDKLVSEFPELGVLQLNDAYVLCPQGWIFTKEGYLLPDHSWFGQHISEMKVPLRVSGGTPIRGNVLSLLSDWASINYGHFLLDSITRYHLFQKAGLSIEHIDYILCPGSKNSRKASLIHRLGLPPEKCIWVDRTKIVVADTLFVTSYPGVRRNYPPWIPIFLKKAFGVSHCPSGRRLYITRGKSARKLANEKELVHVLLSDGFEVYDPTDHNDTMFDFAGADIVMGPHGAGLSDIVFCPPDAKVLELIPSDHMQPYFYTLAESTGLKYACLVGRSVVERKKSARGPSPFDFIVDIGEITNALRRIMI